MLKLVMRAAHDATPVRADQCRVSRTVSEMMSILAGYLPDGCVDWFAANQPYVVRFLREARETLEAAVLTDDRHQLVEAMAYCTKLYLRVVWVYDWEMKRERRRAQDVELHYQGIMVG